MRAAGSLPASRLTEVRQIMPFKQWMPEHRRTRVYRYRRGYPDIPCAMALRLISCSPRRRIRLATVADGLKDCLNPVGSTHLRQLDTSNGCQDHTVLPYAASRLRLKASPGIARLGTQVHPGIGAGRLRAVFAHGPNRPANTTRARRCRVHATRPNVPDCCLHVPCKTSA